MTHRSDGLGPGETPSGGGDPAELDDGRSEVPLSVMRGQASPLDVCSVLLRECVGGNMLHGGLFDTPTESMRAAQQRSNALVDSMPPPSPCSVLEVGIGFGARLRASLSLANR